jgi:hypothetical protein
MVVLEEASLKIRTKPAPKHSLRVQMSYITLRMLENDDDDNTDLTVEM